MPTSQIETKNCTRIVTSSSVGPVADNFGRPSLSAAAARYSNVVDAMETPLGAVDVEVGTLMCDCRGADVDRVT